MELTEIFKHHILDHTYTAINIAGFTLPITKHLIMMWIAGLLLIFAIPILIKNSYFRSAIEAVVIFVRDEIVVSNMGEKHAKYTGYFCSLFFFILVCNLIGIVPFGATATGNISVTGALALSTFLFINFAGIKEHGLVGHVKSIAPQGIPWWLYPILFPIELLSYVTKTFALCIRLFANMIAGHFVLLSLIGMIFIFAKVSIVADLVVTVPFQIVMSVFIYLLEIFVAFLQAYIFTVLTAIFTGAVLNPH